MERKIGAVILIGIILSVLIIGSVYAMSEHEQDIYNKMNLFSKIQYALSKGFFLFTSWGEANGCSVSSTDAKYGYWEGWIRGSMSKPTGLPSSVSCSKVGKSKCAIDIWYDNTIYLGGAVGPPSSVNWNNWLKEVTTGSFSSTDRAYYYVEIYGCPDTPPDLGDWETKVYKCDNGIWNYKGDYEKDEYCSYDTTGTKLCWCNDEDKNFYIDKSGIIHCRKSSYSSVNDGTWCPAYNPHVSKICHDNDIYWVDSNSQIADKYQECGTNGCLGDSCNTIPTPEPIPPTEGECDGICKRVLSFPIDSCISDCERDLKDSIQIYDLNYANMDGSRIEGKLTPGQQIRVTFTTRATSHSATPFLAEVGIIPFSTAEKWDMAKPEGFYSIFDLFATSESSKDACCVGQSNFADNMQQLSTTMWVDATEHYFDFTVRVPDDSIKDLCGSEIYWDNSSSKYVLYAIIKNGCFKDGYKRNVFVAQTIDLNYNATASAEGKACTIDSECGINEKCLDAPGWFSGKTCQAISVAEGSVDLSVRQKGIYEEDIIDATIQTLMSSVCTQSEQCENETQCKSLQSLVNSNVISDIKANEIANTISGKIISATGGLTSGIGITVGCAALLGLVATPAVSVPICLAVGVAGGTGIGLGLDKFFDTLVEKKLEKTGLCIIEEKSILGDFFRQLAFFKITGNKQTDGIIIGIGGIVLIFFLISMLGGRK